MDFPKEEYEIQYYDFCLTDFADQSKTRHTENTINFDSKINKQISQPN